MSQREPLQRTDRPASAARVVRFALAGRSFAVRLSEIAGLAEPAPVQRVPGAVAAIVGVADWRGRIVTVVDLRTMVGVGAPRAAGPSSWLRLAIPRDHIVLHIDGAVSLSPPASVVETGRSAGAAGFLRPCVRDGESLELIDPQALMRTLELAQRSSTQPAAAATGG